jgi:Domain of unknown function (DUF932)
MTNQQPLTNQQLERYAPSIFATEPWKGMSDKYKFIPTIAVVEDLRKEGFLPVSATQSRSRIDGKAAFTKHQIRFRDFRNGGVPAIRELGTVYPEIVLTNSHDGGSVYALDAGLFRLVCTNGMVVPHGNLEALKVRHTGNIGDVISITHEIVEEFPKVIDSVEQFSRLRLTAPQQQAFATAALTLKYDDAAPITPDRLLEPRRYEDREPTLWNTLNTVQEKLIQGGDRYRTQNRYEADPETGRQVFRPARRLKTRPVNGISENTKLNKALWTLAEELRKAVTQ